MKNQTKITVVILLQVLAAMVVVFGGPHPFRSLVAITLILLCAALMLWSVLVMRLSRLRISPEPHRKAQLLEIGPYRFIRHPMYLSVLIFAFIFLVWGFNALRLVAWIVLLVDLIIKMRIEEQILADELPGYTQYCERTSRLVPHIF